MTGSHTVWLEWIGGIVLIKIVLWIPVFIVVLGDPVVVLARPGDDAVDDAAGSIPINNIARGIGDCKKSLDCVHVRIETAVGVELRELGVPRIKGHALLFVPEILIKRRKSFVKELLRALDPGTERARSREDYESVSVAHLVGKNTAVCSDPAVPAAVLSIMKFAPKTVYGPFREHCAIRRVEHCSNSSATETFCKRCRAILNLTLKAGRTKHGTDAVDMSHPACDPRLARLVGAWCSVLAKIIA